MKITTFRLIAFAAPSLFAEEIVPKYSPGKDYLATVLLRASADGSRLEVVTGTYTLLPSDGVVIPGPGPGPGPSVPDGEFGLTKQSYGFANTIVSSRAKAGQLSGNYSAVASQAAAGGYLSIGAANDDLSARNRVTLPDGEPAKAEWLEAFFKPHAAAMKLLQINGDVSDLQGVAKAYKATADGLKLIK